MTTADKSIIILLLTFVAGCAMQSTLRTVQLQGFVFRNQTSGVISKVEVRAPKTNAVAGCTNIPPGAECSSSFPLRRYQGNPLILSWISGGKDFQIKDIVIRPPEKLVPGQPVTAILTFGNNGSFTAELVQSRDETGQRP